MHAVVQHSAAGYKGDTQFTAALETRTVTQAQATKVHATGGVVFASYAEAEDYAMAESYPPGYGGMIPAAPGSFSRTKVDGLRVYVPTVQPAGALT